MGAEREVETREQVLVAAFPGELHEVHLARLEGPVLTLAEATVQEGNGVSLGRPREVRLAEAALIDVSDGGCVTLVGRSGTPLVQMFLESSEDQSSWASALRAAMGSARQGGHRPAAGSPAGSPAAVRSAAAPPRPGSDEDEDEMEELVRLQGASRHMQGRIEELEGVSSRRDKHLKKMLRRLDGAMTMLSAVQDMCLQQRKVIMCQGTAILELRKECGEDVEEEKVCAMTPSAKTANATTAQEEEVEEDEEEEEDEHDEKGENDGDEEEDDDDDDELRGRELAQAEAQIAAKTAEMNRLLEQADKMQRLLAHLEAQTSETSSPTADAHYQFRDAADNADADAHGEGPDEDDSDEPDDDLLARLQALEAQKETYEDMLRDSQDEQTTLLSRLAGMRSLMSSLGVPETDEDGDV